MPAFNRHGSCCCSPPVCACNTPDPLTLTRTLRPGGTAGTYPSPATLSLMTSAPSGWSTTGMLPPWWWGPIQTSGGQPARYALVCSQAGLSYSGNYALLLRRPTTGSLFLYYWFVASSGNSCSPFLLANGQVSSSSVLADFTISG